MTPTYSLQIMVIGNLTTAHGFPSIFYCLDSYTIDRNYRSDGYLNKVSLTIKKTYNSSHSQLITFHDINGDDPGSDGDCTTTLGMWRGCGDGDLSDCAVPGRDSISCDCGSCLGLPKTVRFFQAIIPITPSIPTMATAPNVIPVTDAVDSVYRPEWKNYWLKNK